MSPEEIEGQINKICWGGKFAFVKDIFKNPHTIIIKSLSLKDRNFVEFIYKEAFNKAKDEGILTRFELQDELKRKGLWTDANESSLLAAKSRAIEIKKQLDAMQKGRQYKITERLLMAFSRTFVELNNKKVTLFSICAEEYAADVKNAAIVFCSTYGEDEKKYWKNYGEFQKETDGEFIRNIIIEINKFTPVTTKELREIARSPQWRFKWGAGKLQGNLFRTNLLELDAEQQSLLYWSQVYDSVYEAYERPSDDIINNDEALDEWFDNEKRKKSVSSIEKGEKVSGVKIGREVARHGEIFIMANPAMNPDTQYRQKAPSVPTTQEIEALNTSFVRKFKTKEQEVIKERGAVSEKELRGRNNRIARKVIGSSEAVIGAKGSSLAGRGRGGKGSKDIRPGGSIGAAGIKYGG